MAQEGRWGGKDRKKHPTASGPPTKQGGVLPGAEKEHPHEQESTPLARVRKKGKKQAAPAATKQDTQGKGHEGTEKEKRKCRQETDALRRSLKEALTPDAVVWGAQAVSVLVAHRGS